MVLGSPKGDSPDDIFDDDNFASKRGITSNHAFLLVGIIKLDGELVVKIRNPHGTNQKGDWKGDWSTESGKWTESLKKEAGFSGQEKGELYMNLADLVKEFEILSVGFYHDDYLYSSFRLAPDMLRGLQAFEIQVQKSGEYYVSMHIPDTKFDEVPDFFYHSHALFRFTETSELMYVSGKHEKTRDAFFLAQLRPGKYILVVSIQQSLSHS